MDTTSSQTHQHTEQRHEEPSHVGHPDGLTRRAKGAWSTQEDALLESLVAKFGPRNWATIADHLPNRSGKQCRERWLNHLDPDISKRPWTPNEEQRLLELHLQYGNHWARIARNMPGRTDNSVKNRWNSNKRRKLSPPLESRHHPQQQQQPQPQQQDQQHQQHQQHPAAMVHRLRNNNSNPKDQSYAGQKNSAVSAQSYDHSSSGLHLRHPQNCPRPQVHCPTEDQPQPIHLPVKHMDIFATNPLQCAERASSIYTRNHLDLPYQQPATINSHLPDMLSHHAELQCALTSAITEKHILPYNGKNHHPQGQSVLDKPIHEIAESSPRTSIQQCQELSYCFSESVSESVSASASTSAPVPTLCSGRTSDSGNSNYPSAMYRRQAQRPSAQGVPVQPSAIMNDHTHHSGVGTLKSHATNPSAQRQDCSSSQGQKRLVSFITADSCVEDEIELQIYPDDNPVHFPSPPIGLVDFVLGPSGATPGLEQHVNVNGQESNRKPVAGVVSPSREMEARTPPAQSLKRTRRSHLQSADISIDTVPANTMLSPKFSLRGTSPDDLYAVAYFPLDDPIGDWSHCLNSGSELDSELTLSRLFSLDDIGKSVFSESDVHGSVSFPTDGLQCSVPDSPGSVGLTEVATAAASTVATATLPVPPPPPKPLSPCDLGTFENTTFGLLPIF